MFAFKRLLLEGFSFPCDFGFIPSTKADGGDPLDILLMSEEPVHVGCLVDVRLIGLLEATETENGKSKQ